MTPTEATMSPRRGCKIILRKGGKDVPCSYRAIDNTEFCRRHGGQDALHVYEPASGECRVFLVRQRQAVKDSLRGMEGQ